MEYINEIFLPITEFILEDVVDEYQISNYGRVFNSKYNRFMGGYSKTNNRYECSLRLKSGKLYGHINTAALEYCVFNNIKYCNTLVIEFKDRNNTNLFLENLFNVVTIFEPGVRLHINPLISSANYHIKNEKIMCYHTNEVWVDITDNEIQGILPIYMISSYGRVYNKQFGTILYTHISYNGYINAFVKSTNGKYINMSIHRTMMKCFFPIPDWDKYEVNHIDSNSFKNVLSNLEWVTPEVNEKLMLEGYKNIRFTDLEVNLICQAFQDGLSYMEIAYYVLHQPYIGSLHAKLTDIKRRITYTNISKYYNF
jgi:hypothetical protein